MNNVIRSARTHSPPVFLSPTYEQLGLMVTGVTLRQASTASGKPESKQHKDKTQNKNEKTGDVMSHSFGEGYATRSDEEGFGGIYRGNQSKPEVEIDKEIHENHPAYDKSQGSEVKEKEKSRFQANASS